MHVTVAISVLLMRQGELEMGLGEEMYEAFKAGTEMPQAVDFNDDDPPKLTQIKHLINEMTSYERSDRPTASHVLREIEAIQLKVKLICGCIWKFLWNSGDVPLLPHNSIFSNNQMFYGHDHILGLLLKMQYMYLAQPCSTPSSIVCALSCGFFFFVR